MIRVNNRRVLTGLLDKLHLADRSVPVLRALDKLAKVGADKVADEIVANAQATPQQAQQVLALSRLTGSDEEVLQQLESLLQGNATGEAGVHSLRFLRAAVHAAGVRTQRLAIDVSIARGLDYYTGTVVETFLTQLPEIGSVCSGGRYDDLASVYTSQRLPGIGASLGLDRLLAALDELGMVQKVGTTAPVFIPYFDADRLPDYLQLAARVRQAGWGVELFPEPKRLGQQLKYADRRGARLALIAGQREFDAGVCQIKDLRGNSTQEVPLAGDAVIQAIGQLLGR